MVMNSLSFNHQDHVLTDLQPSPCQTAVSPSTARRQGVIKKATVPLLPSLPELPPGVQHPRHRDDARDGMVRRPRAAPVSLVPSKRTHETPSHRQPRLPSTCSPKPPSNEIHHSFVAKRDGEGAYEAGTAIIDDYLTCKPAASTSSAFQVDPQAHIHPALREPRYILDGSGNHSFPVETVVDLGSRQFKRLRYSRECKPPISLSPSSKQAHGIRNKKPQNSSTSTGTNGESSCLGSVWLPERLANQSNLLPPVELKEVAVQRDSSVLVGLKARRAATQPAAAAIVPELDLDIDFDLKWHIGNLESSMMTQAASGIVSDHTLFTAIRNQRQSGLRKSPNASLHASTPSNASDASTTSDTSVFSITSIASTANTTSSIARSNDATGHRRQSAKASLPDVKFQDRAGVATVCHFGNQSTTSTPGSELSSFWLSDSDSDSNEDDGLALWMNKLKLKNLRRGFKSQKLRAS